MAVSATNTFLTDYDTEVDEVLNAATSSTINEEEVITIQTTGKDHFALLEIYNGTGHGSITYSVAAGDNKVVSGNALTGTVAAGKRRKVKLMGGRYKTDDGKIAVTLKPATGKRLATDHAAGVVYTESV